MEQTTDNATTPQICGGLRVVEFAEGIAAPSVTMLLADHGAEVLKVESPAGDWARRLPAFSFWNRGKRSVVLDITTPDGRDQALALACSADVVVEALAPGAAREAGIDGEAVLRTNPAVVFCAIDGYGPVTDLCSLPMHEAAVAAKTGRFNGLDRLSGGFVPPLRDGPIFSTAPVGSFGAGQLAAQAILAALRRRLVTGEGELINTSLLMGASAFLMRQEMTQEELSEAEQVRRATVHRGIELCFATPRCKDGKYIQMCARQDHHFRNWMRALDLEEEVFADPRYVRAPMGIPTIADIDELEDKILAVMRQRTQAEWMRLFIEEFDVGADPFFTPAEFLFHEQMVLNYRVVDIDDPIYGKVRQLGALADCSRTPACIGRPAPQLGRDTEDALRMLRAAPRPSVPARPARSASPAVGAQHLAEGTTILELAYFIAGPMATAVLAELGARVIKIEPFGGDPYRRTGLQAAKFLHGKESIVLDLKAPEGLAIAHRLAGKADGFIHNFRPGVVERLGMDFDTLAGLNDQLVYVNASSYGSTGPQAGRIAFHSTGNAVAGGGVIQAGTGNPPVDDSYPDPGGALAAATALALGLYGQQRGLGGQYIETMMLGSTGFILSPHMVVHGPDDPPRCSDHLQRGFGPTERLYQCNRGWVLIAALSQAEEEALRAAFHIEAAATEDSLAATMETALLTRSAQEWEAELTRLGVPAVCVDERTFDQWLIDHDLVVPVDDEHLGKYYRLAAKVKMARHSTRFGPAPTVGQHTEAILSEIGLSSEEIAKLADRGVVGVPGSH